MDTFLALGSQGVCRDDTTGKKSHFGYIIAGGMRLTSHPLPTGISNVAGLIFYAFNQPPRAESINTSQSFVSLFSPQKVVCTLKLFFFNQCVCTYAKVTLGLQPS